MTDFEDMYARYFRDVYKYALSLCRNEAEAEEITQETFFKAMQGIGAFKGECTVYVWLCQIARNTYFSLCSKKKRYVSYDEIPEHTNGNEPERTFLIGASAFEIHKALHKMDEPYKEVLMLRIFGELSFAQIAELFGRTESWARVTYHRAKIKLKEMLV